METLSIASAPQITQILLQIIAFMLALTVHECSHALMAYWLGDSTARDAGRLTLNPIVHVDLMGLIALLFFGIGWAKPVPVNAGNFRYPKLFNIITGLAGPASNLIFALLALYGLAYLPLGTTAFSIVISTFLKSAALINTMLAVFNLLPIPPLDGGQFLLAIIPPAWQAFYTRNFFYFLIGFVVLLSLPITQLCLFTLFNTVLGWLQKLVF